MPILPGSQRVPEPGAFVIDGPRLDSEIEFLISLKLRSDEHSAQIHRGQKAVPKRQELGHKMKQNPYNESLDAVLIFTNEFHLEMKDQCGDYLIIFSGTVANINRAFQTELKNYRYQSGTYLSRENGLGIPVEVFQYIDAVLGLDTRPIAKPLAALASAPCGPNAGWLKDVTDTYALPSGFDGTGECIGILEFNGQLSQQDIQQCRGDIEIYFNDLCIQKPQVDFQSIPIPGGGVPLPSPIVSGNWELALDIQVAGSLAPNAQIIVYATSNTDAGWPLALCEAVHDTGSNPPRILSISWGAPEPQWPPDALHTCNRILQDATANPGQQITVCAASGDDGCSFDPDGYARVVFPASSPYVLACGGTTIQNDASEIVWTDYRTSASGGGISDVLPMEDWQKNTPVLGNLPDRQSGYAGRKLPDVAALAARRYSIVSQGQYVNQNLGGTSAAAPLWAGIIACMNQVLRQAGRKRIGYFNPALYTIPGLNTTFRDVESDQNGLNGLQGYEAKKQWDACTGWGSPNVQKLLPELIKTLSPSQKYNRKKPPAFKKKKS